MTLNIQLPENTILKPRITVFGVGGAGGNATNNMVDEKLDGVSFVVANTDAQALENSVTEKRIQLGQSVTKGLGAGSNPEIGKAAAEEAIEEINEYLQDSNMVFITAGMGGGTGTGAAPVIAKAARDMDILTVGVVTKPFHFEGARRMRIAEVGLEELQRHVDTLIVIPNQNLFRVSNEQTTFADAFKMADDVLYSGVRGITDLMVMPGLINLDFADVRSVMSEMGKAMMGTGEAEGERRASDAAEAAISNPLLDNISMKGARGVLINITGGQDMTLFEVDEAANRIREEVDEEANIIFGSTFNQNLEGKMRVSVVATGIDSPVGEHGDKALHRSSAFLQSSSAEEGTEAEAVKEPDETQKTPVAARENVLNKIEEQVEKSIQSDESDEYYQAMQKLNQEYEEKQGDVSEQAAASEDIPAFSAKEPVEPESFIENEIAESAHGVEYDAEEDEASSRKGGLFSRVAKVAKSLHGGDEEVAKEPVMAGEVAAPALKKKVANTNAATQENLLDIPAFLRRKK